MMCNRILKNSLCVGVLSVLLTGCLFDDDSDVLNRANAREAKSLDVKDSLFCYDIDRNPHMEGWTIKVNGEVYQCVKVEKGTRWALESELLNAI
tara:strand:+ start:26914 stop:27195 length:282 start_codon:yes stop_codon:yes gene_type:complete